MKRVIKKMLYIIELKKGFRKVGEMRIEVDPYMLDDSLNPTDSNDIEEAVNRCDRDMFDIEVAINCSQSGIRAHLKRLTNIEELNVLSKDEWKKTIRTEKKDIVMAAPSKEGKKHHKKLEKKWKKMENKHSKKGKK